METGDFNNDNQQQQDTRRNRRIDYRFLVPSRDAGGLKIEIFILEISSIFSLLSNYW
jgi:hypothetical protein